MTAPTDPGVRGALIAPDHSDLADNEANTKGVRDYVEAIHLHSGSEGVSTHGTSEMDWGPDTSLIEAAREIAPIIQEHSAEAERERRLSQPVLTALRETGLLRMNTPR